jgi:hypothetical protein
LPKEVAPAVNQQRGHPRDPTLLTGCAIYTAVEEILAGEVLAGTFILYDQPINIIFDSEASHNFMNSSCAKKAKLSLVAAEAPYMISIPGGRVDADRIIRKIPLELAG